MDAVYQAWLVIGLWGVIGFALGWGWGYIRRPETWTFLLRRMTGKNWGLILLRYRGGQVKIAPVLRDKPMVAFSGGQYTPDDEETSYMGSVPLWAFNDSDTHALSLKGSVPKERYRDPSAIESMFMIMKAMYEALASKNAKFLQTLCYVILAISGLCLIGAIVNWGSVNEARAFAAQAALDCGRMLNYTIPQLPNALGG